MIFRNTTTRDDFEANLATNLRQYGHDREERWLTKRQVFYLLVPQGLGAAIIDAGVNFGIATAMYRTTRKEIRLWPLNKNTIAGDMGLTVIIQGILSTIIVGVLVRSDIRARRIEAFKYHWPETSRLHDGTVFQRKLASVLDFFSPHETITLRNGWKGLMGQLVMIILRGFLISALFFCIFWPIAIAITAPLYGKVDMQGTWTPEIIKAVFAGLLGLFQNSLLAALVLGARVPGETSQNSALSSSIEDSRPIVHVSGQPGIISTTRISPVTLSFSSQPSVPRKIASTTKLSPMPPPNPYMEVVDNATLSMQESSSNVAVSFGGRSRTQELKGVQVRS